MTEKKRFICLGCYKIRDDNETCCEKHYRDAFTLIPYRGSQETGAMYEPPHSEDGHTRAAVA